MASYHNHLRRLCDRHVKNYRRHSIKNSTTVRVPIFLWMNTKNRRTEIRTRGLYEIHVRVLTLEGRADRHAGHGLLNSFSETT